MRSGGVEVGNVEKQLRIDPSGMLGLKLLGIARAGECGIGYVGWEMLGGGVEWDIGVGGVV